MSCCARAGRATTGLQLVLALALALLAGCTRAAPPNVLLIVVDTLRADRLGAYGNRRGLTPFLDSFAERAFVFRNAYTPASWTTPAVASLFTSRYPSQHQIVSFRSVLAEQELTLGEILAARGYATGGFSANFLLNPRFGYWQGFAQHHVFINRRAPGQASFVKTRADAVSQAGLAWLAQHRQEKPPRPFFLYLHYMEPHSPYDPEPEHLAHVLGGRPRPDRDAVNKRMILGNVGDCSDELLQGITDYYDAEVRSLDARLRELFAALAEQGLLDDTIVAITADHGEELREHDNLGHGHTLHREVVDVPLLVRVPGRDGRADVEALVSLIDIAPTLLDLSGASAAPSSFEGRSLRALMNLPARAAGGEHPQAGAESVVFGELLKESPARRVFQRERMLITPTGKMVEGGGAAEFYDLAGDPGEANPQGLDAATRAALQTQLAAFAARVTADTAGAAAATPPAVDAETLERMRALGYHE